MTMEKQDETSYKETAFGIIPRSKLIPLEIEGIKRAWDFILEERKKGVIKITPEFIKKMHLIGFEWIFPKMGGQFRKIEVTVSKHIPPKYYLVPELIINFCKDLEIRIKSLSLIDSPKFLEELVSLLTWAQHRFLWIHPFQDYNGRIARLLTNLILINLNLPPIELKVETENTRKEYIEALQQSDNGNFQKLEKLIEKALKESVEKIKNGK